MRVPLGSVLSKYVQSMAKPTTRGRPSARTVVGMRAT
jgi:hypothetical protein